jgi:hypothetical protein
VIKYALHLIPMSLAGSAGLALGFNWGRSHGYREGAADTIVMFDSFDRATNRNDGQRFKENKKILDMFADQIPY